MTTDIVTRFAPSPTGYLHVGGARTAVFNWLLARSGDGRFILRVEDTDRARSTPEAVAAIHEGMAWLGLDADETVSQSARADQHNALIDRLLESGAAYWCSCTPEQVEAMRETARAQGRKPKYDLSCRDADLGPGPDRVVRLKAPLQGRTAFTDLVKGEVSWPNQELDDMILRRSDGSPTYNLAVVADDLDMGVTHIVRGDDHLANTPRQILVYRALGRTPPVFGHLPLILGPDKKKLSKRHGAVGVTAYRDMGILPEAMFNYLVRLGWSHGDQEIFSQEELLHLFDTDHLGASAAVFDQEKLLWLNAHYVKHADPRRLAGLLEPHLAGLGVTEPDTAFLAAVIPLFTARAQTLEDMAHQMLFLFQDESSLEYDHKALAKFVTPDTAPHLDRIRSLLADCEPFDEESVENLLRGYIDQQGIKFKTIAQPLRVALTGKTASPGIFETITALGKDACIARIDATLARAAA
jgi:glutamyl-tRNA synthetase